MSQDPATQVKPHGLVAKIFHWGFLLVFAYALTKQIGDVSELSDSALLRFEMVFALAFLALLAVRYSYMRVVGPSALPDAAPRPLRLAARAGHLAMYISLAMIAISGLIIGALVYAGGTEAAGMDLAIGLHETSVMASYIAITVHVAAAIFHRIKGDGIWSAMVPVLTEKPKAP